MQGDTLLFEKTKILRIINNKSVDATSFSLVYQILLLFCVISILKKIEIDCLLLKLTILVLRQWFIMIDQQLSCAKYDHMTYICLKVKS